MPTPFPSLQHFQASEFKNPLAMDATFLHWLDAVRHNAGVPFILTSDARTPERNLAVGGSPTSLHVLGRAVDFTLRKPDNATLFKVMQACVSTPTPGGLGCEVEYVLADRHFHVGLFPDTRPSRLVLKASD